MTPLRFRPQAISARWRQRNGPTGDLNWDTGSLVSGITPVNRQCLARTFYNLHYRACHAPDPIRRRWKSAYQRFQQQHWPSVTVSVNYVNGYSMLNWL